MLEEQLYNWWARVQLPEPRKRRELGDLAVITAVSTRGAQWGAENELRTMWDCLGLCGDGTDVL